jgi:hypothetical protein
LNFVDQDVQVATTLDDVRSESITPRRSDSSFWREVAVAAGLFGVFAVIVLTHPSALLEPDDYAYRASIVALAHGHLLLTTAQYQALATSLGGTIMQWHQLASGLWISEKNPGYPFLAAPFYLAHALRLAPLAFGAMASVGLFAGARRWLGRWGGVWAVGLFLGAGVSLAFAWRATMPTFTDASLIAAGAGGLLWALLASDVPTRRRATYAALASAALMAAVFVRYTNVVVVVVAAICLAIILLRRTVPRPIAAAGLATMAAIALILGAFNLFVYGGITSTGYSAGEITFSLSAISGNLTGMPKHLVRAMPAALIALAALVWIVVRWLGRDRLDDVTRSDRRRDVAIGATLAAAWAGIWLTYLAYPWTLSQSANLALSIHVVRFYVPAVGLIALLGAWLVHRAPMWTAIVVVTILGLVGVAEFHSLISSGGVGPLGPGGIGGGVNGLPGGPPPSGGPPPGGGGPGSGPPPSASVSSGAPLRT